MTWKEFKEQVEKAGVKDEYEIDWIDLGCIFYEDVLNVNIDIEAKTFTIS